MDNIQLCTPCLGLNIESLTTAAPYQHVKTRQDLRVNAQSCPMCRLIDDCLSNDEDSASHSQAGILCSLDREQDSIAVLKVTAEPTTAVSSPLMRKIVDHALNYGVRQTFTSGTSDAEGLTLPFASQFMNICGNNHRCEQPFRHPLLVESAQESYQGQLRFREDSKQQSMLDALPARLIFLNAFGENVLDARLLDIPPDAKQRGAQAPYESLSYCWGPDFKNMYKTTLENLDSRKERILWSELPKTFQDAFHIARTLEISLLWIDAICIIQDSKADWKLESAKMGAIYATGVITIAADVSDSVDGGILNLAEIEDMKQAGHVEIPTALEGGYISTLCFYNEVTSPPGMAFTPQAILDNPLSSRAWCMQERILSARVLHFTKKGLICECRESYFSLQVSSFSSNSMQSTLLGTLRMFEEGLPGAGWGLKVGEVDSSSLSEDNLMIFHSAFQIGGTGSWRGIAHDPRSRKGEQHELVSWWYKNIVAEYSRRRLTFETDKMMALSGIATTFGAYIRSQYIAGLGLADIEEGLEWKRAGATYQDKKLGIHPSLGYLIQGQLSGLISGMRASGEKTFEFPDQIPTARLLQHTSCFTDGFAPQFSAPQSKVHLSGDTLLMS